MLYEVITTFTTEEEPSFIELIVKSEKFKLKALQYEEGTVVKRVITSYSIHYTKLYDDRHKKEYRVEKIYGQKEDVYLGNERQDIPSVDTIFGSPVYFGQKDLSNKHIDFEADLVITSYSIHYTKLYDMLFSRRYKAFINLPWRLAKVFVRLCKGSLTFIELYLELKLWQQHCIQIRFQSSIISITG